MLSLDSQDMLHHYQDLIEQGDSDSKEFTLSAGDLDSVPGLGRPPGEGNGYLLQYSYLENPKDRGAWLQSMGLQRIRHD